MSIYTFCWNLFKKEAKKLDIVIDISEQDIVNAVENIRARKREVNTINKCSDEIKEIKGITDDLRKYVSSTNERIFCLETKIFGLESEILLLQKEKADLIRQNKRLKKC